MAENDEVTKDFNSCKRLRSTQMAQMTKLYTELETQIIPRTNVDQVKCLFEKLCDKFELFKTAYLECLDACSDSGIIDSLEATYRSCQYKLKRCSNKECCKQCRYVMFKGTMTKWPVQKLAQGTTQIPWTVYPVDNSWLPTTGGWRRAVRGQQNEFRHRQDCENQGQNV